MIRRSNWNFPSIESRGWWKRGDREAGEWADEGELKW